MEKIIPTWLEQRTQSPLVGHHQMLGMDVELVDR